MIFIITIIKIILAIMIIFVFKSTCNSTETGGKLNMTIHFNLANRKKVRCFIFDVEPGDRVNICVKEEERMRS